MYLEKNIRKEYFTFEKKITSNLDQIRDKGLERNKIHTETN